MQASCRTILDTARELLEFGVMDEGVNSLVTLRRCAHACGCSDWHACSCEIDVTWSRPAPAPARPAAGKPPTVAS